MTHLARQASRLRTWSGARLYAHLGTVVAGCLSAQCGAQSEGARQDSRNLESTEREDGDRPTGDPAGAPSDEDSATGGRASDDPAGAGTGNVAPLGGAGGAVVHEPGAGGVGVIAGSGAGGASGSPPSPPVDVAPSPPPGVPVAVECGADGKASLVSGLNPAEPVDELAHYTWYANEAAPMLLAHEGQACEVDAGACPSLDAAPPTPGFFKGVQTEVYEYLVYRRGETLGYVLDQDQLIAFLGTIDTPNEAALVLWGVYRDAGCDTIRELPEGAYWSTGSYMVSSCPVTEQQFDLLVAPDGGVTEEAIGEPVVGNVCIGRRPEGLLPSTSPRSSSPLAAYFTENARLEASAVLAFAALERELRAHGAPPALLARVRAAAADERRHAKVTADLARRFEGSGPHAVAAIGPVRGLLDIALENATEGCVRELYGAAVAQWQALHARDLEVRRTYEAIARDEAEHAALSLSIADWLHNQLSTSERAQVEHARACAREALRAELLCEPDPDLVRVAGVPTAQQASSLLDAVDLDAFAA